MTKAGLLTEHGTVLNRNITPSLRFWSNGSRKQDRKEKKDKSKTEKKIRDDDKWEERKEKNAGEDERCEN